MTYISTLPTPPSRSDDPTGFSNKADALLGALPDFVTEANALSDEVDAMRDDAEAKRAATATLKAETQDIKDAAVSECGTIKTACETARDLAQTYKNNAETAKTQAETAKSNAEVAAAAAAAGAGLPALTGNAGKVLKVNSGETGVEFDVAAGIDDIIVLTSGTSGTWPADAKKARIKLVGGGGGGAKPASGSDAAKGGAAGGLCDALIDIVGGESYSYAIGAGGAAVTTAVPGNDGGTTTLTYGGTTYTATGGQGGPLGDYSASKGLGGIGTNGDINIGGSNTITPESVHGMGADSPMGNGGINAYPSGSLRVPGFGGGGAGVIYTVESSQAGGNGAIILEIYK